MIEDRKVVVIAGPPPELANTLVEAFLDYGFRVVIAAATTTTANDLMVFRLPVEVGYSYPATKLLAAALKQYKRIDTLISCVNAGAPSPKIAGTESQIAKLWGSQIANFIHTSKTAADSMSVAGKGHIITLTNSLFEFPEARNSSTLTAMVEGAYAAGTRALALEFAQKGVRVNAVSRDVYAGLGQGTDLASGTPLRPHPTHLNAGEIAEAAMYLDAAKYITGEIRYVGSKTKAP